MFDYVNQTIHLPMADPKAFRQLCSGIGKWVKARNVPMVMSLMPDWKKRIVTERRNGFWLGFSVGAIATGTLAMHRENSKEAGK